MFQMLLRWFKRYSIENTRRYPRLPASWPIKCESKTPSDGRTVTHTRDIGAGGVSVSMKEPLPLGTPIRVEIHIPPLDCSVSAQGQVIRCFPGRSGGFEVGIQFTHIEAKDRATLNEAIEEIIGSGGRRTTWWRKFS